MLGIDLKGKVAVVTGVTSGIGLGVAKMLSAAGADISGCGRSEPESSGAQSFIQSVKENGSESLYISADVTLHKDLENFVEKTKEKFGRIDILVSNAGINVFKGAKDCTLKDYEFNDSLNLRSHWYISRLCRPMLAENGDGTIIIITSNHAFSTMKGCFPYNVSKTALTGLVRSLALEWGPEIRTVGIAPGFIYTPASDVWFDTFDDPSEEYKRTVSLHPVKRLGSVEEVGALCCYLSGPYARFITGTTIVMDGGRTAVLED